MPESGCKVKVFERLEGKFKEPTKVCSCALAPASPSDFHLPQTLLTFLSLLAYLKTSLPC
jgi:hypothetical protein